MYTGGDGYLLNINCLEFSADLKSAQAESMKFAALNISVYPNPTTNTLNIVVPEDYFNLEQLQIVLYNMQGQLVLETNAENTSEISIDLNSMNNGIYYLMVSDNAKKSDQTNCKTIIQACPKQSNIYELVQRC